MCATGEASAKPDVRSKNKKKMQARTAGTLH
jgi:hypothetical protein